MDSFRLISVTTLQRKGHSMSKYLARIDAFFHKYLLALQCWGSSPITQCISILLSNINDLFPCFFVFHQYVNFIFSVIYHRTRSILTYHHDWPKQDDDNLARFQCQSTRSNYSRNHWSNSLLFFIGSMYWFFNTSSTRRRTKKIYVVLIIWDVLRSAANYGTRLSRPLCSSNLYYQ